MSDDERPPRQGPEGLPPDDGARYQALRLDNQLCFPLYACAKEVVRRYKEFLDPLGLTYTQYIAMMAVWEHRRLTVKELGEHLRLDSGTLTPLLKKLEAKGLVTRERSESDERSVVVRLTEAGRELEDRALGVPASMGSCLGISRKDAADLRRMLDNLLASASS